MNLRIAVIGVGIVLSTLAFGADIGGGATVSTGIGLGGCAACAGIGNQIKQHAAKAKALVEQIRATTQQAQTVREQLDAVRGDPKQAQRARTLESQLAELQGKIEALQAELAREQREIDRLEAQLAAAERQAANSKSGQGGKSPSVDDTSSGSKGVLRPSRRDASGTRQDDQFDELQKSVRDLGDKGR